MTIKNFITLLLTISFFNIAVASASEVTNHKNINIAVVDLENVLKNCDAMKDAQNKISKKQTDFQKEIDEIQKKLEKDSKLLASKKASLKDEAFKKEQDKFSKKVDELKELVDSRQDTLKKLSLDAVSKINDAIKKVVDDVKEEKKLDIILSSSSAIFYRDDIDISAEILKKLNKTISKVKIN